MVSVHLLVLVHGMWGNPNHLAELNRIVSQVHVTPSSDGTELRTLMAETNRGESTYDGIDWGGERLAAEVVNKVHALQLAGDTVIRFSITGYSLGGLLARYLVGVLFQRGFFENIQPINFNTFASPHIGLPKYPSLISSVFSSLGPKLLSRTGEQFYCRDQWSKSGRPLLLVMADPSRIFYHALSSFKHIRIYANSVNDLTVPYVTAAIAVSDPFVDHEASGINLNFDEQCPSLIRSYTLPLTPAPTPPKPVVFTPGWFKSLAPKRPIIPPILQMRFPFNILFYIFFPFLVPVLVSMIMVRLILAARLSRERIEVLEKDARRESKLIHVLRNTEKNVEDAVVDFVEDPNPSLVSLHVNPKVQPILSLDQRKMVAWMDQLEIQKEIAHFPGVRNSHAIIVCRDMQRFEHRLGEGVVKHWANSFIL